MNFKPTKWKIIVSVVAVILWFILNFFMHANISCKPCPEYSCELNYYRYYLVKPLCSCECHSLADVILSNILNIIIPFAIVYIIWSLIEKSRSKSKNKGIRIMKRKK